MLLSLAERLLYQTLKAMVRAGRLTMELPEGRSFTVGAGGMPTVRARLTDVWAVWALLLDPDLRVGELFMDERLVIVEGTIYDFLEVVLRGAQRQPVSRWVAVVDRVRFVLRRFAQRNGLSRARRNVSHHYDLDGRLYRLFLDGDMQYSCAYFTHDGQTLDEAQLAKKRHIAAKMLIAPQHRALDIGCGWGGMALYLAQTARAAHVTGVTLSTEQLSVGQDRVAAAGLGERIDLRLTDYRNLTGTFDRIVSVGMFEHVGIDYYDAFFRKVRELLADDGVMLLHYIGNMDVPDFTNPWIDKYIFPGGHIPALSEVMPAIERAALVVTDVEVLRIHYAKTLRAWRERFMARRAEAVALYDERFCRMWEFYLSMSEAAFYYQDIAIHQIQIAVRQDAVPLTRDYVGIEEARLKAAETAARAA